MPYVYRLQLLWFSIAMGLFISSQGLSEVILDLEVGAVKTGYNYFKRPNDDSGTRIDLEGRDSQFYTRFQAFYQISPNQKIRLLLAPLTVDYEQTATLSTRYDDTIFPAGSELDIRYQFNSWRLGYIYTLVVIEDFHFDLGFTGKIRDALIRVKSNSASDQFSNIGFVPLIYMAAEAKLGPKAIIGFQADGAAAPQGGAIDLGLFGGYHLVPNIQLKLGGRYLEGGADNDSLEGFAQFWYGFGATSIKF